MSTNLRIDSDRLDPDHIGLTKSSKSGVVLLPQPDQPTCQQLAYSVEKDRRINFVTREGSDGIECADALNRNCRAPSKERKEITRTSESATFSTEWPVADWQLPSGKLKEAAVRSRWASMTASDRFRSSL